MVLIGVLKRLNFCLKVFIFQLKRNLVELGWGVILGFTSTNLSCVFIKKYGLYVCKNKNLLVCTELIMLGFTSLSDSVEPPAYAKTQKILS
jgi:hypothetical protein